MCGDTPQRWGVIASSGMAASGSGFCSAASEGGSVRGSPCGEPARLRLTSLRPHSFGLLRFLGTRETLRTGTFLLRTLHPLQRARTLCTSLRGPLRPWTHCGAGGHSYIESYVEECPTEGGKLRRAEGQRADAGRERTREETAHRPGTRGAAGDSSKRAMERGGNCVERNGSERAEVASVAERKPPQARVPGKRNAEGSLLRQVASEAGSRKPARG
jgi:hypothetical protein